MPAAPPAATLPIPDVSRLLLITCSQRICEFFGLNGFCLRGRSFRARNWRHIMKKMNVQAILAIVVVLTALCAPAIAGQPLSPQLIALSPGNSWPLSPVGMPKAPFTVRFTSVHNASNYMILLA